MIYATHVEKNRIFLCKDHVCFEEIILCKDMQLDTFVYLTMFYLKRDVLKTYLFLKLVQGFSCLMALVIQGLPAY